MSAYLHPADTFRRPRRADTDQDPATRAGDGLGDHRDERDERGCSCQRDGFVRVCSCPGPARSDARRTDGVEGWEGDDDRSLTDAYLDRHRTAFDRLAGRSDGERVDAGSLSDPYMTHHRAAFTRAKGG